MGDSGQGRFHSRDETNYLTYLKRWVGDWKEKKNEKVILLRENDKATEIIAAILGE